MERAKGRGRIPSILKKPVTRKGDLLDKSSKIKREKLEGRADTKPLPQGCTPLMYACQQADYTGVVEALNKDPASIRVRDRGLRSVLHYCASSGAGAREAARAACADRVLMAAPALVGARDVDGLTPLHLAVVHGNVPLVQTLLAAGADVNATDDEHHTVVHWATVCGEVGALRAVLAAGANAATADQHGGYPLHYAAQMCGAPATTDHQSRGAALEVLRALLREGGARVAVRDADGRTPLLWAASAGSAAAVLALTQAGAKVDDADRDGLTALHCAAARGHTEALETLVGLCGARVDVADTHGCTPLHYAAALGHADATVTLLDNDADAHRQDKKGRSPAHTAAAKGQIETVRILGARGANLWLRNSKGDLPLHEAVASGRRELVKWLLDGRPSQVNATNHEGRTPLHIAAATDNADLCRLILDRGAEINPVARSSKNEPLTPLDCATIRGHRSTAKYLQMHGGLPASKLSNTQIIIDGAPITSLPTRKVTSTRIDVRDKIRIEKREVVEVSSPVPEKRRFRRRHNSTSTSSSGEDRKYTRKPEKYSNSQRHHDRRKRLMDYGPQKSFSDGYDTDNNMDKQEKESHDKRHRKESKNGRSRSEPSRRSKSGSKYNRRYQCKSESSSETENYSERKKSKRHRRRSKRRTTESTSESSSSETSERRSTKRKGKKTSIHIENDDEKQSVNIIKYKNTDDAQQPGATEKVVSANETSPLVQDEIDKDENRILKAKTQSETETDTVSVKTNMIVTEAQIHVERESSQQGSSEITVTVDDANNVSIATTNMSVTHKDLSDERNFDTGSGAQVDDNTKEAQGKTDENESGINNIETAACSNAKELGQSGDGSGNLEAQEGQLDSKVSKNIDNEEGQFDTKVSDDSKVDDKKNMVITQNTEMLTKTEQCNADQDIEDNSRNSGALSASGIQRRKSFQVLSGPGETLLDTDHPENVDENTGDLSRGRNSLAAVSFTNKDEIFQSKDSAILSDNLMGEEVLHSESGLDRSDQTSAQKDTSSNTLSSEDKRKEYASTTAGSSTEAAMSMDKGLVTVISASVPERAVQQVIMEGASESYDISLPQASPKRIRKTSKDSHSSRKSSIYETESYKVLSDIASAPDMSSPGILKRSTTIDETLDNHGNIGNNFMKISPRVPSVSDNEIYSHSEANGRRKRFRKKGRTKSSRTAIRSKSENSERGYESSGLMDSGFEPSPRVIQRRIMSPRLAAYYQQRNASGRHSGKSDSRIPVRKPGDKRAVDMKSVTQRIQTNMRRYYCERKIFQHLLELKRLQIRTSKANEAVLVKRAIDEYNQSSLSNVALGPYNNPDFSFSSFEKFLYESLRKLQKSGKKHLDNLPLKPVDFDYGESELYKMANIPDNPCLCTNKTHRCYHAVHAYTGVPCSAYIPYKWNHHTMPKPATAGTSSKSKGFLPKINSKPPAGKAHVTLEVSHGSEKQLIALPAEKLDKNKRYYVTFTVKGSEPPSDNDNTSPPNTKNVRSG